MMDEQFPLSKQPAPQLKKEILQSYFTDRQQQLDSSFVDTLFAIAHQDESIHQLITCHSFHLLTSSQNINQLFFLKLINQPNYTHIAHKFLKELITMKITIKHQAFEIYIIESLPELLTSVLKTAELLNATIVYLALKMRSFDLKIRVAALKTMKKIGQNLENVEKEWGGIFKTVLPLMIEKQKLVKEVSYVKGLFLHVLEDEFSQVRQLCMQILILFRKYIKPEDLKLIIIYMLNDEHERVREETLKASKYLKDQLLNKEDLQTLMMCLRQNQTNMRNYVYQTLSAVSINDPSLLLAILDKVFPTLQNNKSDKKFIYRMLMSLGKKYARWVDKIIGKLNILDQNESNWKSITYKAKMIFCYQWWKQLDNRDQLPLHFSRHMLYIRDVEIYLFDSDSVMKPESNKLDFSIMSNNHLVSLIEWEEQISQQFHKFLLSTLRCKMSRQSDCEKTKAKLKQLSLVYKLGVEEEDLIVRLNQLLQQPQNADYQVMGTEILIRCLENREKYEDQDTTIEENKCRVSKAESNLVVASKGLIFQQRVILKCYLNSLISKEPKVVYKKLYNLIKIRSDSDCDYFALNLICFVKVECILCLQDDSERVLDTYTVEVRL